MKKYILAHDLGTTGNKATLYDHNGRLVGCSFTTYETQYPYTGWAEQDPEDWWDAVCTTTADLLEQTGAAPQEVICVSFSGQMMGCVPVDRRGMPLRKAIIWADQRAVEQERWVAERIDPAEVYHITGHRLSASYSLAKILWVRQHQPLIFKNTYKFLHAKDTIIARLTGALVTDPSDASGMNLYNLERGAWSHTILDAVQLSADLLPEVHPSIDVVGSIQPDIADEIGLVEGTPVVAGGGDGACAAAGAGVVAEGAAYNYIGSSSWIAIANPKPIYDPDQKTFTFGHIVPGMFMPTGTMQAAGASYQWLRDQLCQVESMAARAIGISAYEFMNNVAATAPAGANGLLFLPYLMGERSPRWNPQARGGWLGLTMRHTRADMIRAVLEGVTLNLRVILDAFRAQGVKIEAMRVIGGGAKGRFWNQLMADVYNLPVQRLNLLEEATSMGAALAGGIGVGLYRDFRISEKMNPVVETFIPNPTAVEVYNRLYPLFEQSYQALVPVFASMAE